jgi:hypothetical protein
MSDRTVHAKCPGMEVVRYDRAGKWYLEPTNSPSPRQRVSIDDAVAYACWALHHNNGTLHLHMPGGGTFDSKVLRRLDAEVSA